MTDEPGGNIMKAKEKKTVCSLKKGGKDEGKNEKTRMVTVSNNGHHQYESGNDGYGIRRDGCDRTDGGRNIRRPNC